MGEQGHFVFIWRVIPEYINFHRVKWCAQVEVQLFISILLRPSGGWALSKVKKTVNFQHSCCSTPPQRRHLRLSDDHPHQTSRGWDDMHFVELDELYKNMCPEKLTRITNAWNDMVPNSTKYSLWTSDLTVLCELCPDCPQWYMLSGCRSVNSQYIFVFPHTPWCRCGPIIRCGPVIQ